MSPSASRPRPREDGRGCAVDVDPLGARFRRLSLRGFERALPGQVALLPLWSKPADKGRAEQSRVGSEERFEVGGLDLSPCQAAASRGENTQGRAGSGRESVCVIAQIIEIREERQVVGQELGGGGGRSVLASKASDV